MKKVFLVYSHYNEKSFNASIRDTFIKSLKERGHKVDLIDLYKEKFDPVFSGEEPDHQVLNQAIGIHSLASTALASAASRRETYHGRVPDSG